MGPGLLTPGLEPPVPDAEPDQHGLYSLRVQSKQSIPNAKAILAGPGAQADQAPPGEDPKGPGATPRREGQVPGVALREVPALGKGVRRPTECRSRPIPEPAPQVWLLQGHEQRTTANRSKQNTAAGDGGLALAQTAGHDRGARRGAEARGAAAIDDAQVVVS